MASRQTNDTKRDEMKNILTRLLAEGWTRGTLANLMGVTASAVSAWSNGKSMGTNDQRARLASLPAFEPAGREMTQKALEGRVASIQSHLASQHAELDKLKADTAAAAVNGVFTEIRDYNWDWCDLYEVSKTDVATGDTVTNKVTVYKKGNSFSQAGEINAETQTSNRYAGSEFYIKRSEKDLAAARKALKTFLK